MKEMLIVLLLASGVYENVIDEDDFEIIEEWAADSIHEVYKCCSFVRPKGITTNS